MDLSGVKQAGRVHFVADMLNEKGEVEKSFTADAAVEAKPTQTVTVSWPWANPRLWDVDQPNLYTLRLKVKGAGLDDQYDQEFGFREFWVEGRQFYLNGTVIHLRQPCFYNGPLGQVGDNFCGIRHLECGYPRRCLRRRNGTRLGRSQGIPGGGVCPQRQQVHEGSEAEILSGNKTGNVPLSAPTCGCATTAIIPPR